MNSKKLLLWLLAAAAVYLLGWAVYRLFIPKPDYSSVQNVPAPSISN